MGYYSANEIHDGVAHSWEGGSAGILYQDRRKFYLNEMEMAGLYPNIAPFLAYSSEAGIVHLDDPDFKLFVEDDNYVNQQFTVKGSPSANWDGDSGDPGQVATFEADGFKAIGSGDNLKGLEVEIWNSANTVRKGVGIVTGYNASGNTVTVKFIGNYGGNSGQLADDDNVYVIGNAQAEGSRSPESWHSQPSTVWNSAQIEKTSLEITGTLYEAALRGSKVNEFIRMQKNKMKEHLIQRERKLLFGERAGGTGSPTAHLVDDSGKLIRTTAGIVPLFNQYGKKTGSEQNVFDVESDYDYDKLVDDTQKIFQHLPEAGYLSAQVGGDMLSFWNKIGSNGFVGNMGADVRIAEHGSGTLGYNYRALETPHGIIRLTWNPLLRGNYSGHMIITDKSTVQRGIYRAPKYETAIQENDFDGQKDQYFSDEGLVVTDLRKNSLMVLK